MIEMGLLFTSPPSLLLWDRSKRCWVVAAMMAWLHCWEGAATAARVVAAHQTLPGSDGRQASSACACSRLRWKRGAQRPTATMYAIRGLPWWQSATGRPQERCPTPATACTQPVLPWSVACGRRVCLPHTSTPGAWANSLPPLTSERCGLSFADCGSSAACFCWWTRKRSCRGVAFNHHRGEVCPSLHETLFVLTRARALAHTSSLTHPPANPARMGRR